MSILFYDDFGHNDVAISTSRGWSVVGAGPSLIAITTTGAHVDGDGRGNPYTCNVPENRSYKSPGLTGTPRVYHSSLSFDVGGTSSSSDGAFVAFYKSGTVQCTLKLCSDGYFRLYRSTGTLIATAASPVVDPLAVGWLEIDNDVANTGTTVVRYKGIEYINFSGDNQQAATSGWDQFAFGLDTVAGGVLNTYWSDVIVTDSTTGALGESTTLSVAMDSDSTPMQFTPSTGTVHYSLVNEIPPTTTGYNEATTTGLFDALGAAPLPYAAAAYYALQLCVYAMVDAGAVTGIKSGVTSGPTTDDSSAVTPGSAGVYAEVVPKIWEVDPNTTAAWTESGINSATYRYGSA